jgi:hypothetical protein
MPIDQVLRGLALRIDTSVDPETQPLLEYSFIEDNTQRILARIRGRPQPDGGGQLAFETNAGADTTTPRMLIDHQGNVGIGTENPLARLEVGGDVKFNGPLTIQGALTVSGVASIGADLTVTGKLTAASFTGDGTGLNNVRPADGSVTSAKLALDAASLGKVSGGMMVISANNVGIGTANNPQNRLHVGPGTSSIAQTRVNAVVASNTPDAGIAIAQNSGVNVLLQASGGGGYIGTTSNHPLVFRTNDLDRVVVNTKGNLWVAGDEAGIVGIGKSWVGVYGETNGARNVGPAGVWGEGKQSGDGVKGVTSAANAAGVAAFHLTNQGPGIFAQGAPAGLFNGDVTINGRLRASVKSFVIDHPLDPANKYLIHSAVESPDLMNVYSGEIVTDTEGNATVVLPEYFEALNGDFRYQLTVIGKLAQVGVASEIENNRFTIKTDQPEIKVSWQVTGIRQDASAKALPASVEEEKPEAERGLFLHPEHYGHPEERGIAFAQYPQGTRDALARMATASVVP